MNLIDNIADGPWGWELTVDVSGCDINKINSSQNIEKFAKELVKRIDMVAFGHPQVNWFGSGDKEGYTLVQLIETSNITAHFVPPYNAAFFNIFSCKEFDVVVVMKTIIEFFGGKVHDSRFTGRYVTRSRS